MAALASIAHAQTADSVARFAPEIDGLVAGSHASVEALYRDIRAHPELALEEVNTAKKLATAIVEASQQPGGKPLPINHSPYFAPVPEPSLKAGIKAMTLAVLGAARK